MLKDENIMPSNFLVDVAGAVEGDWYHEGELNVDMDQLVFASKNEAIFVFLDEIYVDISIFEKIDK